MSSRRQEMRSRWGCVNCRNRRKKCDETRPSCHLCIDRRVECTYPDWSSVKYSNTRQRRYQHQSASFGTGSGQSILLPALPKSTATRFIHHFNTNLSSLITFSIPHSGNYNPFMLHVLPRTSNSLQVQCAVEAVAAAHLYHLGSESCERATKLHTKTLKVLAEELSRPRLDESSCGYWLACSLLLIYYEIVLGNSPNNAWCHLEGAKVLLEYQREESQTSSFIFFRKIFQYFNVMLALSLGRRPLAIDDSHTPYSINEVDAVFGCAGQLWPLMYRLADLIGRSNLGEDIKDDAAHLSSVLNAWHIESPLGEDTYTEAMVQIARSYQFCGLLMLDKLKASIDPTEGSGGIQTSDCPTYRSAFDSVLRVCVLSTPMATLTWPLYVVGRFATSTSDRTIILHIFAQFLEKHHMQVIDGARDAVEAHWRMGLFSCPERPQTPLVLLG